jgi:hypothetical protein
MATRRAGMLIIAAWVVVYHAMLQWGDPTRDIPQLTLKT